MKMSARGPRKTQGGGALVWLVVLLVVGVLVYFVWLKLETLTPPVVAESTPPPATPEPATPRPATPKPIVQATPTPPPEVAVATPAPTPVPIPPPLDIATVARTPALWPPQVLLLQPVTFPVVLNGRPVGEVKVAAGTAVRVLRVGTQQTEVEYQSNKHIIPVASTDLMPRALAIFRNAGSVLPEAPATPAPVAAAEAATPAPAGSEKLNVGISVERKRLDLGRAAPVMDGGERKSSEKCAYTIKVQNHLLTEAPPLELKYIIFVERQKLGQKKETDTSERIEGSAKTETLVRSATSAPISTSEFELWKRNIVGNYYFVNGGRQKVEDNIEGVWIRATLNGKVVAEYANPSTITKRGWENKKAEPAAQ
jgi:hypothetical protein